MARKRYTTEQIIGLLREAEVRLGQGQTIGTICRGIGVSEQSAKNKGAPQQGTASLKMATRLKRPRESSTQLCRSWSQSIWPLGVGG